MAYSKLDGKEFVLLYLSKKAWKLLLRFFIWSFRETFVVLFCGDNNVILDFRIYWPTTISFLCLGTLAVLRGDLYS